MNEWINKIGINKVLHFSVGAFIAFSIDTIMIFQEGLAGSWTNVSVTFIGLVVVAILALIKEVIIDAECNWKDFLASVIEAIIPTIMVVIGTLFYIASN